MEARRLRSSIFDPRSSILYPRSSFLGLFRGHVGDKFTAADSDGDAQPYFIVNLGSKIAGHMHGAALTRQVEIEVVERSDLNKWCLFLANGQNTAGRLFVAGVFAGDDNQ